MTRSLSLKLEAGLLAILILAGGAGCSSSAKKDTDEREAPVTQSTPKAGGRQASEPKATVSEEAREPVVKEALAEVPKPRSVDRKYEALSQATRSGKASAMQDEAAKILANDPSDAVALNTLAIYHLRRGRTGAAKLLLERAFEKNQDSAALLNNLGVVFLEEDNQHAAIASFKRAIKLDDRHMEALGNLGSIYLRGGDATKATPFLEAAYKTGRANGAIANNYAIALRAAKDYEGARKVYEGILDRNSRDVAATLNLAILYIDFLSRPKDGLALVYKVKVLETERKDVVAKANALEKKAKSELK
jgi:Flp pilus assembly protein TadD